MSDFVPPPQEHQKATRSHNVGTHDRAPEQRGSSAGVKQQLRLTDGIDAQNALLTPRENTASGAARDTAFERTGRGKHEWRMALLNARNHMIGAAVTTIGLRADQDEVALEAFQHTMEFAEDETVLGLAIGGTFNALVGTLSGPIATVRTAVELVGDIYTEAAKASRGARLDTWIERHRDAANQMTERGLDAQGEEFRWASAEIDRLVADESDEGEREKQRWEENMLEIKFPVVTTAADLEHHLYERWCEEVGARLVVNLYRTDRLYPGHEEVGRADQETTYGGRQIFQEGVPPQILRRLGVMKRAPKDLDLPVEHRHHEREPGTGRWVGREVTRFDRDEEPRR